MKRQIWTLLNKMKGNTNEIASSQVFKLVDESSETAGPSGPVLADEVTETTTREFVTPAQKIEWSGKQNALTFDPNPTASSNNPVESGGVYSAIANAIAAAEITETGVLIRQVEIIKTGFDFAFNDNSSYTSLNTATWSAGTTKGAKLVSAGAQNFINTGKFIDNNVYSITLTAKAATSNTAYFGFGIKNIGSWGGAIWRGSNGACSMLNYNLATFVSGGGFLTQPTFAVGDVISVRIIFSGKETYIQTAVNGVWNQNLSVSPAAMKIRHGGEIVIVNRDASTWDDMTIRIEDVNEYSKEVFVASTGGSDLNNGTYDFPLATIVEAKQRTKGKGWITLKNGDYFDQVLTFQGGIKLRTENNNKARLIYGTRFSSATLVDGFTKVYSVPYAPTLTSSAALWQHDTVDPASLILQAESHALHRGASHRLSSCKSTWLGSTALLEATDGTRSNFFWSGGTLFFTIKNGTNLTTNPIVIPDNNSVGTISGFDFQDVEILNLDILYRRVNLTGSQFKLTEVSCLFSGAAHGFQYGQSVGGQFIRCRAGGVNPIVGGGGDGFNGSNGAPTSPTSNITTYISHDCWSHDNKDDGDSLHNHGSSSIFGGLYEYNAGGGIASASGGHMSLNGSVIRRNTVAGVGATGVSSDGGSYTNLTAIGCVMANNGTNSGAGSGTAIVTLMNCSSLGGAFPAAGANTIKINCVDV